MCVHLSISVSCLDGKVHARSGAVVLWMLGQSLFVCVHLSVSVSCLDGRVRAQSGTVDLFWICSRLGLVHFKRFFRVFISALFVCVCVCICVSVSVRVSVRVSGIARVNACVHECPSIFECVRLTMEPLPISRQCGCNVEEKK